MNTGLIHIYTGDGKGKTTAAAGLCLRALGYGFDVCFATFNKDPEKYGYKELIGLEKAGATVVSYTEGHPYCDSSVNATQVPIDTLYGLKDLQTRIQQNNFQMLVLDEILISLRDDYLNETELIQFIQQKPKNLELILTGRGASENVIKLADYVSDIQCVSHPYSRGITSRQGIEC